METVVDSIGYRTGSDSDRPSAFLKISLEHEDGRYRSRFGNAQAWILGRALSGFFC